MAKELDIIQTDILVREVDAENVEKEWRYQVKNGRSLVSVTLSDFRGSPSGIEYGLRSKMVILTFAKLKLKIDNQSPARSNIELPPRG
jgi:hypothetical protein